MPLPASGPCRYGWRSASALLVALRLLGIGHRELPGLRAAVVARRDLRRRWRLHARDQLLLLTIEERHLGRRQVELIPVVVARECVVPRDQARALRLQSIEVGRLARQDPDRVVD